MAFAPPRVFTDETRPSPRVLKYVGLGPDQQAIAKAELAQREEDWLKSQVMLLQNAGDDRLKHFGKGIELALDAPQGSPVRENMLMDLHNFIMAERGEEGRGGYNGHLPNQLKKRRALRIAISNLFIRAFGPKGYGWVFHPKTSDDVKLPSNTETNGYFKMPDVRASAINSPGYQGRRP